MKNTIFFFKNVQFCWKYKQQLYSQKINFCVRLILQAKRSPPRLDSCQARGKRNRMGRFGVWTVKEILVQGLFRIDNGLQNGPKMGVFWLFLIKFGKILSNWDPKWSRRSQPFKEKTIFFEEKSRFSIFVQGQSPFDSGLQNAQK